MLCTRSRLNDEYIDSLTAFVYSRCIALVIRSIQLTVQDITLHQAQMLHAT